MSPCPCELQQQVSMGNCLNGGSRNKKKEDDVPATDNALHVINTVYTSPTSTENGSANPADISIIEKDPKKTAPDFSLKRFSRSSKKVNGSLNDTLNLDENTSKTSKVGTNNEQEQKNNVLGQQSSRKSNKYAAKFDHRVTAKYDIKALIGRGNFSRVVRVEHRLTKKPYAIKMVDRTRGRELAESELNVLRRVRHMYIIQLLEVFESREKLYMVVELATGGELYERVISVGHFDEKEAIRILKMVLEGLQYLHSLGIAHRDLKPENLLFYHPGEDSRILITDFGMSAIRKALPQANGSAREAGNNTVGPDGEPVTRGENEEMTAAFDECCMRTICGTPEYIAPEILANRPYTGQVDLWAVGVIAYILLSGTMPFDDDSRSRLFRLILRGLYNYDGVHWKTVSSLGKDFIDRLLVIDPFVRLTAAEALAHPWITTPPSQTPRSSSMASTISTARTKSSQGKSSQGSGGHFRFRHRDKSSVRSSGKRSVRSEHSLRSDRRRVDREEIEALHRDPELQAELSSLASKMSSRYSARS